LQEYISRRRGSFRASTPPEWRHSVLSIWMFKFIVHKLNCQYKQPKLEIWGLWIILVQHEAMQMHSRSRLENLPINKSKHLSIMLYVWLTG